MVKGFNHNINENDSHLLKYNRSIFIFTLSSLLLALRCHCNFALNEEFEMLKWGALWMRFRKEIMLAWAMLCDRRTPFAAKLATIAAIMYLISPIDLITDLLPIVGWLDDGLVGLLLLRIAQRLLHEDLHASLKAKSDPHKKTIDAS